MTKPTPVESAAAGPRAESLLESRPLELRWLMIGLALSATIINYLDRQVLSVVVNAPDFQAAVPLTQAAYGYVAAAFMLAYALMNGLSGPFIDYVGTRVRLCLLHALVVAGRHPARLRADRFRWAAAAFCSAAGKRAIGRRPQNS